MNCLVLDGAVGVHVNAAVCNALHVLYIRTYSAYSVRALSIWVCMYVRTCVSSLLQYNMVYICQRDNWCPQHNMLAVYVRMYIRTLTRKEPFATFNEFY